MPHHVKKIVFTGDILRPFSVGPGKWESATWKNIRWLENLLSWQLNRATGLPHEPVSWTPSGGFNAPAIYQSLSASISYSDWAALFYMSVLPEQVDELLVRPFVDTCVIGVEIPDILQHALTKHHIPFIDIVSHPVRFMEDLLFAFRTNIPSIHQALLNYQYPVEDSCIPQANLLRAKISWMPHLSLPPDTALITGQVAIDKALISREEGRFLSLADYTEKVLEISDKHPLVLFKPHPYQNANCPSRKIIEMIGTTKTVNHNFYYLLAQAGLTDVYAINSGTVTEANYFGLRGHALGDALYSFDAKPPVNGVTGDCVTIGKQFLEPSFWADILKDVVPVKSDLPAGPPHRPSLLRRSLNADWDYGYIDEVVQHKVQEAIA